MVRKLEMAFREIVTESLDAIAKQGNCDFVEDVAVPLPLLVIAEMIGIRREDRMRFHEWSDAMIRGDGTKDPAIMAKAGQAFVEYSAYVTEIIEDRRREPEGRPGLASWSAPTTAGCSRTSSRSSTRHHSDEHQLSLANNELIMLLVILLVAGNETTRNGLSGGMQLLIENPGRAPEADRATRSCCRWRSRRWCGWCRRCTRSRAPPRATPSCAIARSRPASRC